MNMLSAIEATKSILLAELDTVTSAFTETEDRDEQLHWLGRLRDVNKALQFFENMSAHKVIILEDDQYRVVRTLVDFHHGNDDFGDDPNYWPYDRDACDSLSKRLDNQAKANNY